MMDQRGGPMVHRLASGPNQEAARRVGGRVSAIDQARPHPEGKGPFSRSNTMCQEVECPHRTLRPLVATLDPAAAEPPVLQTVRPELRPNKDPLRVRWKLAAIPRPATLPPGLAGGASERGRCASRADHCGFDEGASCICQGIFSPLCRGMRLYAVELERTDDCGIPQPGLMAIDGVVTREWRPNLPA